MRIRFGEFWISKHCFCNCTGQFRFLRNDKFAFYAEMLFLFQNTQPGLSGNPFLHIIKFYQTELVLQKRLGTEDGNSCPNNSIYRTDLDEVS